MKKRIWVLVLVLGLMGCSGGGEIATATEAPTVTSLPSATPTTDISALMVTVTPAPTAVPTNTATPVPEQVEEGEVRLNEDFSGEDSCLQTIDSAQEVWYAADGVYRLEVRSPDWISVAPCESLVVGDFILDVDVTPVQVPEGGFYFYGVAIRIGGYHHYGMILGGYENYCMYYADETTWTYLINSTDFAGPCWTYMPESAMSEETQHIRVVAEGDRLEFYANGELLTVVHDRQLRQGWVGFTAGTGDAGGLVLEYDNLRVVVP